MLFCCFVFRNISNCLRQPRHRAKNVGRVPTDLFVSFPMFQCFFEKMHSRTPTNEQEHCDICTRKRRQIRLDGIQISKKSWFGGSWGRKWGVLEPNVPKDSHGCILGCEKTFEAHSRGMFFGTVCIVFLCLFLLFACHCAQNGIV